MLIILSILTFSAVSHELDLPHKMADFAAPFHDACQILAPYTSEHENYKAIVCGSSLNPSSFQNALRRTGLIHLMVVSGSHLAFLEFALVAFGKRWPPARRAILPALLLFTLVNRLEAPVVRALFSIVFRYMNEHFRLAWGQVQILVMSGLIALGFCIERRSLLSLSLSWLLSLALLKMNSTNSASENRVSNSLMKNTRAYLLIAPGLLPFSLPHPLSILFNALFAPLMGIALFPISLLSFIAPAFAPVSDALWRTTRDLIHLMASFMPEGLERCEVPLSALSIYIIVLTLSAWREEMTSKC